ncbi:uncharacterized protein At4g26450 isoform X2 [Tasmannia lanceolata]|uniref:uncharacterized protein At4g26450 isoform X2 n=1 Tax=Tasmannia lanceolata TaxID=3420 RepID=UPI004063A533
MYARHRSPGDGVRSNLVGTGLASGRISPEGSIRGHGMQNSEFRNFNRGFGRGQLRPYPPPRPPRSGDIFMDAGRLAAEYLVSKGLLPPNSLTGKWQNGNLSSHMADIQEFRVQDRENMPLALENRTSALARLGNVAPDVGTGRRRFVDGFGTLGSRNHARGRRRMGSFRSYGSDWGRENGRSGGSWSERGRVSPDRVEGEDDFTSGYQVERRVNLDVGSLASKIVADELPSKSEIAGGSESELETCELLDDAGSKASFSSARKDLPPEADPELNKGLDDAGIMDEVTEEVKDGIGGDKTEEDNAPEGIGKQNCQAEDELVSNNCNDLLRLCSFAKVPTRSRSALTSRLSKVDEGPITEEKNICHIAPAGGPNESVDADFVDGYSSDKMETKTNSSFMHQQELIHGPPGFGRSMVTSTEVDSSVQHLGTRQGIKRPREWLSYGVPQADEDLHLHNLRAKQPSSQVERYSPDEEIVEAANKEELVEVALFPNNKAESYSESGEEKQILPSSYKICDLNLMEASEIAGSPDDPVMDQISTVASNLGVEKEASLDVGLSINNFNSADSCHDHSSDSKEVTVVDVENGSAMEDNVFDTSEQKTNTMYSNLESFFNHAEHTDDIPNVQDGYNFAISELLGTDVPNCSSVPTGISDVQNEMNLHNEEVIVIDDDPIYLSLGEIPLSMPDI